MFEVRVTVSVSESEQVRFDRGKPQAEGRFDQIVDAEEVVVEENFAVSIG